MTLTAPATAPAPGLPAAQELDARPTTVRSAAGDAAALGLLVFWATALSWGTGGREPHLLSVFAVLVAVAYAAVRPWRTVSLAACWAPTALGAAAFAVSVGSASRWEAADVAASVAVSGQVFVVLVAWSRTAAQRQLLLIAVALAGAGQFAKGWLAWWGGQDATEPFVGTYFWHNQAGIALAIGAVAGLALVLAGPGPGRVVGALAWPLGAAGTLFSTSRGSMACLLLGTSVVVAWHLITTGGAARWRAALRSGLVLATAPLTALALSGPPFFPTRAALGAGTSQRGAVESLGGNTSARLDHWSQAWSIFADRPLTGAGFHSFASAARDVGPPEGVVTAFAHNGYLQALADGGLLLFVPVLLCLAGLALAVLRRLRDGGTHDPVLVGAVTCLGMALLHSGIDFDWDYPALLALTAVLAAGTASVRRARPVPSRARVVPLVAVTAALLCLGVLTAWSGGLDLNAGTMGG